METSVHRYHIRRASRACARRAGGPSTCSSAGKPGGKKNLSAVNNLHDANITLTTKICCRDGKMASCPLNTILTSHVLMQNNVDAQISYSYFT